MKTERIHKMNLFTMAIGALAMLSCSTIPSTGQTVKETRNVSAFNEIGLAMSGDVYISQGDRQSVVVEADKDVQEIILTEIRGDMLVIKTENGHWRNLGDVKVYITVPDIRKLSLSGSGEMVCQTQVRAPEITVEISGSGNVTIDKLESSRISATITGSGNIRLAGNNEQASLEAVITGSGSFKAEELSVANADVDITGSGSARVNVLKELETNITGSGSVQYKGNPIVNARSTGSGKTVSF